MKYLFLLLFIPSILQAACTSISRTNLSTGSVLTATRYNADLNTSYNFLNSYDLGCAQAGSLEPSALSTTDFAPITSSVINGCGLSYSNSNTVSIAPCDIAVNGNLLSTASATSLAWGASGSSPEATGTFYVYAKNQSTFAAYASITAPNDKGYNGNDRVIGSFYNNSLLDIATSSVLDYYRSGFLPKPDNIPRFGSRVGVYSALVATTGGVSSEDEDFIQGSCTNADPQVCTFVVGFWSSAPKCFAFTYGPSNAFCYNGSADTTTSTSIACTDNAGGTTVTTYNKKILCIGQRP